MDPHTSTRAEVDRFITEEIESVPHLEALLLLWNARPHAKSTQELAKALYLTEDQTLHIVRDLAQRELIVAEAIAARIMPPIRKARSSLCSTPFIVGRSYVSPI